jgi:hypothetical protein
MRLGHRMNCADRLLMACTMKSALASLLACTFGFLFLKLRALLLIDVNDAHQLRLPDRIGREIRLWRFLPGLLGLLVGDYVGERELGRGLSRLIQLKYRQTTLIGYGGAGCRHARRKDVVGAKLPRSYRSAL